MTGNGTQANPYIPANWAELKTAAETADAYVKLPAETQWDMNDQYPEDTPGISLRCYEVDFNGALITNLRKASGTLFTHNASHNITLKNVVFSSAYISNAQLFYAVGYNDQYSLILYAFSFGGELYDSRVWTCDNRGVETNGCALNLYLSESKLTTNEKQLLNTIINIDGTVNQGVGTLNLVSSAVYGEVRATGAQYGMSFAGELCVCDLTLQNFNTVMYVGGETTAVLNIDKIGGAEILGNPVIQATSAQMKDAAWLNAHGFPCK